jgi:predicted nucleotidyltransferase
MPPLDLSADEMSALVRVLSEEPEGVVVSAYLFGSHAERRAHRESDVDVGVLLDPRAHPDSKERFERRVRLSTRLSGALAPRPVDLVLLNDVPPLFGRRIVTRGRQILCIDAASDHAYVRDVQLRAADLEPFLRRTQRLKLAALVR